MSEANDWLARRAGLVDAKVGLAEKLARLDKEITEIDAKFKAASVLVPEVGEMLFEADLQGEKLPLTDAILKVLGTAPLNNNLGATREQIKARLPAIGYEPAKLTKNPNYLYIALKRLTYREAIEESNNRFKLKKK